MKHSIALLFVSLCAAPLRATPLIGSGETCQMATVLSPGTNTGFSLWDHWYFAPFTHDIDWNTDLDWYRITVPAGTQLTVQMNITHQVGQIWFVQTELHDPDPVSCFDAAVPFVDSWTVVNATSAPKDYLLSLSAISALPQGDLDLDYDLVVQLTSGTVTDYCPGAINSLGVASALELLGAPSIGAAHFSFFARNMHAMTPAQIFCGSAQTQVPFGDGLRCAGGSVHRLNVHAASTTGTWVWSPSHATLAALPFLAPGSTWNFQVLYRDMNGPLNTGFNLSSAVNITFLP